jgi:hypothetical protein
LFQVETIVPHVVPREDLSSIPPIYGPGLHEILSAVPQVAAVA